MSAVELRAVPYDFQSRRGIRLTAQPQDEPRLMTDPAWPHEELPDVYLDADFDEVEFGEVRTSRAVAAEWFRAVADYLNSGQS